MAANEKFILEFVTKGTEGIDRAKEKIDGVKTAVGGLATALLGVSFAGFISGALQAADRISDFSDATNISIASLKGLEAAMDASGGKGRNLERAINQLYAAMDSANGGSIAARDAFAKVGVSLSDLKNMSEADILQKTLEGLAQMPPGAERASVATTLLSKAFRGIDPKQLLDALDPEKYLANEEATKRAAQAQQELEQKYKTLQEGAIAALEPILNLMGSHNMTVENATKLVQGLAIAFGVLFGAQAIASIGAAVGMILKLNTALKGTAAVQAGLQALQGPKGWAILAGAGVAATAALYGLNKMLEETESKGQAAQDAVAGVAGAAGIPAAPTTTGGKIVQAKPQAGLANRQQELDARQRAVLESQRRIAQSQVEIDKFAALQGASEIQKIQEESAAEIAKARLEIFAKEHLSNQQKAAEFAAKRKDEETKAAIDIARVRREQENMVMQQKIGYQDQIAQMLGYEKSELQKINEQIAQQPEKYKEIGDQMRENAVMQDQNLQYIKKFNQEQERAKQLTAEGFAVGVDYAKQRELIAIEEEKAMRLSAAKTELERAAITEEIDRRKRLSDLTATLLNDEKTRAALLSDMEGDATPEQIQRLVDLAERIKTQTQLETDLSNLRMQAAQRVSEHQRSFSVGWEEAYNKYIEDSNNAANQAKTYFDTFTRGFEDAIVRFVQTGKLSFKDLANSVIAEFARIQAKKIAVGVFGESGTGGGILGSLWTGFKSIFGFADGGVPPVGRPSLVGERGPELFMPKAAGTVIPNNQLGMSGAGGQVVTYNINAVDAASFRALVARDPQFLFQVTERGRRSQPTRSR